MGNLNNPFGFRPISRDLETEKVKTTSNLTLLEGDAVTRKADGTIQKAGTTSTAIYGFAAHGVTGATGVQADALVWPAKIGAVFEVQAATGTTIGRTHLTGYPAGVSLGSSYMVCKVGGTTSTLNIVGVNPNSSLSASLAILRVVVAKSQWHGVP